MQAADVPEYPRSPSAERMARHRRRRKKGLRCVTIALRESEIDALVRRGRLPPESRGDLAAVRKALYGFLDNTLRWRATREDVTRNVGKKPPTAICAQFGEEFSERRRPKTIESVSNINPSFYLSGLKPDVNPDSPDDTVFLVMVLIIV
jgi:hypothetical protein